MFALDSGKIKQSCRKIEQFISSSDEDTVKAINDLCSAIVNINDITRDKLKGSSLALDIKSKALKFGTIHCDLSE